MLLKKISLKLRFKTVESVMWLDKAPPVSHPIVSELLLKMIWLLTNQLTHCIFLYSTKKDPRHCRINFQVCDT